MNTTARVKGSPVGVTTAANTRSATMAWRRYVWKNPLFSTPILPKSHAATGSSNNIPVTSRSIMNVSMYESRDI